MRRSPAHRLSFEVLTRRESNPTIQDFEPVVILIMLALLHGVEDVGAGDIIVEGVDDEDQDSFVDVIEKTSPSL